MTNSNEYTQSAIAAMTAWANGADESDTSLGAEIAMDIETEHGARHLAIGLMNLCGFLLVRRMQQQGIAINDSLREAATAHPVEGGE